MSDTQDLTVVVSGPLLAGGGVLGKVMRTAWLIEPSGDPLARWSTDPFRYHWPQVLARHRLAARFLLSSGLEDTERLLALARCDVVFVTTSWRDSLEETQRIFEAFSRRRGRPRLVYVDTSDPTSSPFFGLLPFVDLMVKKQLLQPLERYREELLGGHVLADHIARQHGLDLERWHFGSPLPRELEHKLVLGWNVGSARELARSLARSYVKRPPEWSRRQVDVHYRVGVSASEDWYTFHRKQFAAALEPLRGHCRLIAVAGSTGSRIPLEQFKAEMREARLAVSPFGWGEVTERDFHIVNNLSLMIKPQMPYLITEPNIYVPNVTYVPVRWDGADLVDVCRHYLERPDEALRIAHAARRAYRDWFLRGGFLKRLDEILLRLDLLESEPLPQPARASRPSTDSWIIEP